MIHETIAHIAPGDKKMLEVVNLKEESGVSSSALQTLRVPHSDYCAVQGNTGHKMCSWYCDPIAACD